MERARLLARGWMRMGVSAVNVGRQDLGAGLSFLESLGKEAGIPWVSANLRRSKGDHPFPRWRVVPWGSARVAIFGLLQPDPRDASLGIEVEDPARAAAAVLRELPPVDGVICLSNLGLFQELELARKIPGLVAIVGGGSAELMAEPQTVGTTLVLHVGDKGKFVGVLDLPRKALKAATSGHAHRVLTLDSSVGEDPEMASWVKAYKDLEGTWRQRVPPPVPSPRPAPSSAAKSSAVPGPFAGSASCRECHPNAYRAWLETGHARAYLALRGKEKEPRCEECHTSTLQSPKGRLIEFSVACEMCHGPAGSHKGRGGVVRKPDEALCRRCHSGFHKAASLDEKAAYERIRCDRK